MVGIVWMVGMVCKSVGYGMFDMTVCMVCMVCMVTMMVVRNAAKTQQIRGWTSEMLPIACK